MPLLLSGFPLNYFNLSDLNVTLADMRSLLSEVSLVQGQSMVISLVLSVLYQWFRAAEVPGFLDHLSLGRAMVAGNVMFTLTLQKFLTRALDYSSGCLP